MRSQYWAFVEACDDTQSARAVKDLVGVTLRGMGVEHFVITTHGRADDLRSLGVLIHNWPTPAIEQLLTSGDSECSNPLFAAVERQSGPFHWPTQGSRRDAKRKLDRSWFDQTREYLAGREVVSQALRSVVVEASFTVTSDVRLEADRVKLCMRIADYAYRQVLHLQKPRLPETEKLTAREHEFLYRATILGERPADVADSLEVKMSTVRTIRKKASQRLDADSQEQTTWRMIETGQLFRAGRKTRPRGR